MELLFILWLGYMVWIGTRTKEQTQNHLALMWVIMFGMTAVSFCYALIRYLLK